MRPMMNNGRIKSIKKSIFASCELVVYLAVFLDDVAPGLQLGAVGDLEVKYKKVDILCLACLYFRVITFPSLGDDLRILGV